METLIDFILTQPEWSVPLYLIGGILLLAGIVTLISDIIEHLAK